MGKRVTSDAFDIGEAGSRLCGHRRVKADVERAPIVLHPRCCCDQSSGGGFACPGIGVSTGDFPCREGKGQVDAGLLLCGGVNAHVGWVDMQRKGLEGV